MLKLKIKIEKDTRSEKLKAEDMLVARDYSEIMSKVYATVYTVIILGFLYIMIMEIKRQYHIQFIPGFKNPLQDFYNDLMNSAGL